MSRRILLAGCGDLGTRLGARLIDRGHTVTGLRRHPEHLPDSFNRIAADLADPGDLHLPEVDTVVLTLTTRDRTPTGYARTYLGGLEGLIRTLPHRPRLILVSSTRVLGTDPAVVVTEDTPPAPAPGPAEVLAEAEARAAEAFDDLIILRPAGIYGRGTPRLVGRVAAGVPVNHEQWTNRIHQADLVDGLERLVLDPDPPRLLHAVDSLTVQLGEVVAFIAGRLGVPVPGHTVDEAPAGKRIDGTRYAHYLGGLAYPTYREGYAAVVDGR